MKVVRRVCCALLLGRAFGANADYSWEFAGVFDHEEKDRARSQPTGEFDTDLWSLSAIHYFNPVAEGSGPPALAAFFDPRTHLAVSAGDGKTSSAFSQGPNSLFTERAEEDISDYSLRGVYVFAESKWYAGGRYARQEGEQRRSFSSISTATGSGESSSEDENYAVFAGKYFGTGATRLELTLEQSTTEGEGSSTSCSFSGACSTFSFTDAESVLDTPRLGVMHVGRFRSATYALVGEYSELRAQDVTIGDITYESDPVGAYFVGAQLYPIPSIGVRVGYESTDQPGLDETTASIGASWFFRPNVGLDLTLSRDDTDIDSPFFEDDEPSPKRAVLRVIGRL